MIYELAKTHPDIRVFAEVMDGNVVRTWSERINPRQLIPTGKLKRRGD